MGKKFAFAKAIMGTMSVHMYTDVYVCLFVYASDISVLPI